MKHPIGICKVCGTDITMFPEYLQRAKLCKDCHNDRVRVASKACRDRNHLKPMNIPAEIHIEVVEYAKKLARLKGIEWGFGAVKGAAKVKKGLKQLETLDLSDKQKVSIQKNMLTNLIPLEQALLEELQK